jgi:hypothetical protein
MRSREGSKDGGDNNVPQRPQGPEISLKRQALKIPSSAASIKWPIGLWYD